MDLVLPRTNFVLCVHQYSAVQFHVGSVLVDANTNSRRPCVTRRGSLKASILITRTYDRGDKWFRSSDFGPTGAGCSRPIWPIQVTRRLTAELKDSKTARSMEKTSINDRVVQELERQLDELKESRERQNEMLATVKNARWVSWFQGTNLSFCLSSLRLPVRCTGNSPGRICRCRR